MNHLQPCVTHVYKCTVTSSSASETNPSPLCDVFSVLTVCNKVVVSGSRLCLPSGLSIGVADEEQGSCFMNQTTLIFKKFSTASCYLYFIKHF